MLGAAFSPITLYGAFTNGWLQSAGLPTHPLALYFIPLGLSFLMALALFVVRGRDLMRRDDQSIDIDDLPSVADRPAPTPRGGELVGAASGTGQHAVPARAGAGPTVVTTGPVPQEEPTRLDEIEATGFTRCEC